MNEFSNALPAEMTLVSQSCRPLTPLLCCSVLRTEGRFTVFTQLREVDACRIRIHGLYAARLARTHRP